jgi:hypothetical protein
MFIPLELLTATIMSNMPGDDPCGLHATENPTFHTPTKGHFVKSDEND